MFIDHCKAIHEGRNHGTKRKSFNNHKKCFSFHLKSSFCSQVIRIFVIPFSPLFLPCQPLHKTVVEDKPWYFEKITDTFKNKEDLILNVKNGTSLCKKYVEKVHQKLFASPLGKKSKTANPCIKSFWK